MSAQGQVDVTVREREYRVQALNQQDLDRNFSLATTHLFKWMQAARMDMPWMQPGYRGLSLVEPPAPRRMLVASQIVRLVQPGVLSEAAGAEVVISCEVGTVGRTSLEWRYRISFGDRLVATGLTTMIVTSGVPGSFKPSPVPEDLRKLAAPGESKDRAMLTRSLAALPKDPPAGAYTYAFTVRFSDEDVNKHANHSALARHFEDAREVLLADEESPPALRAIARQQLADILITYDAESHARDRCEVRVASSAPDILDMWVVRLEAARPGAGAGLIGRGRLCCRGGGAPPGSEDLARQARL